MAGAAVLRAHVPDRGFAGQAREEVQRCSMYSLRLQRAACQSLSRTSCLLSLRDEIPALVPGEATRAIASSLAVREFLPVSTPPAG